MAAYDNVNLPSAPAAPSYAAPLIDFSTLGGYAKDYQEAQQYGVKRGLQTAFKNGIPPGQDGQPDYNAMATKLLQLGAPPESVQPYFNLAQQQQGSKDFNTLPGVGGGQGGSPPTASVPASHPAASGPANITGTTPQGAPGSTPAPNTLRGVLTAGSDPDTGRRLLDPAMASMWAKVLGGQVGPDDPLSDQQVQAIIQRFPSMARNTQGGAQDQQSQSNGPPFATSAPSVRNPQGGKVSDESTNQPTTSTSSTEERVNGAQADPDIARNQGIIDKYTKFIGTHPLATPAQKDAADKAIATAQKAIEQRTELLNKNAELTPTAKDVASGASKTQEQNKDDVTRYGKQLAGIQGSAGTANRFLSQYAPLAEAIYNDPNTQTGVGEAWNLAWKKVKNFVDPSNTESLGQEAYRKVTAGSVLNQVEQLKDDTAAVGGGSRIFQAQIQLMQEAAGNPDNTLPALRLLTEVAKRSAQASKVVAAMANSYNGGHLDAQFAQKVDDYFTTHPMFKPDELSDIRRIAPPTVRTPEDLKRIGWKDGDPFKTPDGRVFTHAPPGFAPSAAPAAAPMVHS